MESHGAAVLRRPELRDCPWIGCDARDAHSLDKALSSSGVDLVVHAAGPFQGDAACSPLEAAIRHGVPYMDVCDDATYAQRAKRLEPAARAAGVPALSTAGIFPGLSNVMAADMVTRHAGGRAPARVLYSYYTAGTGGAGPTILETTFLLAGQDVVVYRCVLLRVGNVGMGTFEAATGRGPAIAALSRCDAPLHHQSATVCSLLPAVLR